MRCVHCEAEFTPKRSTGKYCSAKCRAAAWTRERRDALAVVEDQLTRALTRLQTIRKSGRRG
jgi:hypothetical protein